MSDIRERVEEQIQKELPRSASVVVDQGVLYTNVHFFRYVEGDKHITGDCEYRFLNPNQIWMPWLVRELFAPKKFVIRLESPMRWDNQEAPIAGEQLAQIVSRIDRALQKKYRRYEIEFVETPGTG
jgi:hypothetical protein